MNPAYDDMIDLPHHVSTKHPQMPLINRAAQFAPFAALSGFESSIVETARLTDDEMTLAEDAKETLDRKLRILQNVVAQQPDVLITFYQADGKKEGGEYVCITGRAKKINIFERRIVLGNGERICIDDIFDIECVLFDNML